VGPQGVGKGGIVRDSQLRADVIRLRVKELSALGLVLLDQCDSAVPGSDGNHEAFALFRWEGECQGSRR